MSKYIYWLAVFLTSSIFLSTKIHAESMPIIITMQNTYTAMKNFSATFTQQLTHQESGSKEIRNGILIFEKPLSIKWETQKPHSELLIVNKDTIWDYFPEDQLAYKYSKKIIQDSTSIIQVITGQTRLDKDFTIISEPNNDEYILLHLYPKEPTTQMVEAWLWLNPKSGLIHQTKIIDFYGNTNIITFLKLIPNATINKNTFIFTVPKNVTIENLMDQTVPERPLFN